MRTAATALPAPPSWLRAALACLGLLAGVAAAQAATGLVVLPARCPLLADMPKTGHGSILSPQPPDLPPKVARLMNDPPGFDRSVLPGIDAQIVGFFVKNLDVRAAGA